MNDSSYRGDSHEVSLLRRQIAEQIAAAPQPHGWDVVIARSGQAVLPLSERSDGKVGRVDRHRDAPRYRLVILAGVLLAVLVGGLLMLPRWTEPDAPAATPVTTPARTEPPSPSRSAVERPTLFPALPAGDPRDAEVSAGYGSFGATSPSARALVGRVNGDTVSDAVMLEVFADDPSDRFAFSDAEIVTVDGVSYDVYTDPGSPPVTTVVRLGTPSVALTGIDPFRFIDAAGGIPINDPVTDQDEVSFSIGALPAGYEIIVEPEPAPSGSLFAQINIPGPSGGEGSFAQTEVGAPFPYSAIAASVRRVDVNGTPGWITDQAAFAVGWQLDATTSVSAVSVTSEQDALDFARSLEFIDEPAWQQRYDAEPPPPDRVTSPDDFAVTETTPPGQSPIIDPIPLDQLDRVSVEIIGRNPDDANDIEIDKGSDDGIKVGMPVIDEAGLVGRITTVSTDTSIVMLVTSTEFSQATRIIDTRPNPTQIIEGVVTGQGAGQALTWSTPRPRSGVLLDIQLRDAAVTSGGQNSVAPANIPIGTVTNIIQATAGDSDPITATIEPNANLARPQDLTVVLSTPEADQ